ncbi:MAG: hypothetical protein KF708_21645 [Pirellulales bacterium]|nr:hypothetical protein [Pirellulales bacterium]
MSSIASSSTSDQYDPTTLAGYETPVSVGPATADEPQVVANAPAPASNAPAAEPCAKCQARTFTRGAEWCSACGWYPRLGFYVEPDPVADPNASSKPKPWYQEIPLWAWKLGAGVAALGLIAIIGRVLTTDGGLARMVWALAMFCGGLLAVSIAHVLAYANAVFHDAQLGPLDFVLKPLAVWGTTFRAFPETFRRVASAAWGFSSAFFAMAVVGGLPYYLLWSWTGDKAAPKTNLVHAVVSQGIDDRGTGNEDLAGSIKDFAGEKGDEKDKDQEKQPEDEAARELAKRPRSVDCVVLGYLPQGKTSFESLVLGADVDGKLKVVGLVSDGISPELKTELMERMKDLQRDKPLVPSQIEAIWLDPKLTCRIRFKNWTDKKRLSSPRLQEMLTDL